MAAAALRFTRVKFHIVWTLQMLEQTSQTRCSRVSTMANYITRRIWMSCCSVHGPQVLSDRISCCDGRWHCCCISLDAVMYQQPGSGVRKVLRLQACMCRRAADHHHSDQLEGGQGGAQASMHRRCGPSR